MCNYTVNSITFSSRNATLLKQLHKKVLACYDAAAGGHNFVKDLMKAHGYYLPLHVNNTDHFSGCDEFITYKKDITFFQCETTSAWEDNMLPIMLILKEKYNNQIHLSFCSEDGSDIFLIKDETGVFYPEKFKMEWCINENCDSRYFNSYKEMYQYIKEYFPKSRISYYDNIEDIEEKMDYAYGSYDREYYFYIHRFEEYHSEYTELMLRKEVA